MILAFVRHGQTDFNKNGFVQGRVNIPLNDTGRSQAKDLGLILKAQGEVFDQVLSSPLSRALETANIIRKTLGIEKPIYVDHQFVERDFFHLDGTSVETALPLFRQKNYTYDGYENDQMMIKRITKAVRKLYQHFKDQKVLMVVHSHVIKALLVSIDPDTYQFSDLIQHVDIIYFEITDQTIKVIKK